MTAVDARVGATVVRFDRAERALHWANATLFLILLATGMTSTSGRCPPRSGAGCSSRTSTSSAASCCRCPCSWPTRDRGAPACAATCGASPAGPRDDRRWLLSFGRRGKATLGKFNAGQKLNAIFVAGCIPLMLATGSIMRWFSPFPLAWRTGATFVHDWLALALLAVVIGHIAKALAEPDRAAGHVARHRAPAPRRAAPPALVVGGRTADATAEARAGGRNGARSLVGWRAAPTRGDPVDVRIGLTQTPKELEVQLDEGTDPADVKKQVEAALAGSTTLWFTDRRGRQVGVPVREARLRRDRQPRRTSAASASAADRAR